jgi:hypothetical protein
VARDGARSRAQDGASLADSGHVPCERRDEGRPAALARAKPCLFGGGGVREEADIPPQRSRRRAGRPAIDAGGDDGVDEAPARRRVATDHRTPALALVHGHGPLHHACVKPQDQLRKARDLSVYCFLTRALRRAVVSACRIGAQHHAKAIPCSGSLPGGASPHGLERQPDRVRARLIRVDGINGQAKLRRLRPAMQTAIPAMRRHETKREVTGTTLA